MDLQRFITFEGGEGTGKSTQAQRLSARLEAAGARVELTREPGGSPFAERLRAVVLDDKPSTPVAEALVFAAARADHVAARIAPALADGAWVVCDRFTDSTRVYQGQLNGVDPGLISTLETASVSAAVPGLMIVPGLTIVLDMPVGAARARAQARGDANRYDRASDDTYAAIRAGFLNIARDHADRCRIVDASADAETVADAVWQHVAARFGDL